MGRETERKLTKDTDGETEKEMWGQKRARGLLCDSASPEIHPEQNPWVRDLVRKGS